MQSGDFGGGSHIEHVLNGQRASELESNMNLPEAPQCTRPSFSFSLVQRSLRDGIADRKFGKAEMDQVVEFFFGSGEPSCVYCGASPVQRWDHLIPVSKNGDTVLGNMVPACGKCDDSKRDLAFEEWAVGTTSGSPQARAVPDVEGRLARIREYVSKYGYVPRPLEERLQPEELQHLARIREDLNRLRDDIEDFIQAHRTRSGSG